MPGGSVSVTPTTGHVGSMRQSQQGRGQVVRDLGIIEQCADAVLAQIRLELGDIHGGGFGIVHHRDLEAVVEHHEAERLRHEAENRLRGGDFDALIFAAHGRHPCMDAADIGQQFCAVCLEERAPEGSFWEARG